MSVGGRTRAEAACTDVNRTALPVAAVRARETERPNPLFSDPPACAGPRLLKVDQPAVLKFKEAAVLKFKEQVLAVRTAWLAEGILAYLSPPEANALLGAVGELSLPGSRFAAERTRERPSVEGTRISELWRGGLGKSPRFECAAGRRIP